jgi:TonB family protein
MRAQFIKRLTSWLCCLALAAVVCAQKPRRPAQKPPAPAFDTQPFDTSAENLPKRYLGHDLAGLWSALIKQQAKWQKDKYETTAEYQSRLDKLRRQAAYGKVRYGDLLAFAFGNGDQNQLTETYHADLGLLEINFSWQWEYRLHDAPCKDCQILQWVSLSKRVAAYVGRTAFNRQARVQVYRNDDYVLGFSGESLRAFPELSDSLGNRRAMFTLRCGPQQARAAKSSLRVLCIGYLAERPAAHDYDNETPEIDDPYDRHNHLNALLFELQEVWLYNFLTGEVYERIASPAQIPETAFTEVEPAPSDAPSFESGEISSAITLHKPPPTPESAPTPRPTVPLDGGVLNGKAVSLPKPAYPAIAKAARASGTVVVQVTIDEQGRVISARAVSGHPLLQAAAVSAAQGARFSPTLLSGQPVKVTGVINYNFTQ